MELSLILITEAEFPLEFIIYRDTIEIGKGQKPSIPTAEEKIERSLLKQEIKLKL